MALFKQWLEHDHQLAGPHDFHSLQHYLSLYVLARKFEIEHLENQGTCIRLFCGSKRDSKLTSLQ
jgi:hypothetical protein